ncbi:hypothetical protein SODALDRAFT_338947 [Sodiomyces alkalinus F11]|uniref:5-Methylcytosine G/T mismatch-specific DNA glycosylase n=1 Tax=Sodiomyces alkalinus (strain CBS 110278 / VKM F-3762 / F11) TaxID=1314773 RepID=A0A3N2Q4M1_SODAK|nr:hypothetical protein SODALDRAFT_338947 [Sodiomyces alkalinus F11]ROT41711.1 hypothetical protein SODALDRAFT_338947 [Sodiomyces alkalinus F11]
MPSQDERDVGIDDRPIEKRKSKSRSKRTDEEREHRRSSKSKREGDSDVSHSRRHHRTRDEKERHAATSELVYEFGRSKTSLLSTDRISLPYPTFSKAHSKEAVHSREDLSTSSPRKADPLTPEPTDLSEGRKERSRSPDYDDAPRSKKENRPPSPPDTEVSGKKHHSHTPDAIREEKRERPSSRLSALSRSGSRHDDKSRVSSKSKASSQATFFKTPAYIHAGLHESLSTERGPSRSSSKRSLSSKTGKRPDLVDAESSPESAQDSSPKTPTQTPSFPPSMFPTDDEKRQQSYTPFHGLEPEITPSATPAADFDGPPPPPPPPPALDVQEAPRIDYLLQFGGLPHPVPKHFLSVLPRPNGTRPSHPPLAGAQTLFAPFFNLLDQYNSVLEKSGSVAVATGHRSVARRLLDRLENVFSRELPLDGCSCVVCANGPGTHRGLGWGEVLEWVSGRIELPQWPPFDLAELGLKAAELSADLPPRPDSPIKIDPDIAEEFREHYLRQSKKVRGAVDKWLNSCGETPAPPPQEVDDETLSFAILTNLDAEDRPYFNAIISGSRELQPYNRAPTPARKYHSEFITQCGLALQRLYRLGQVPRDAETALYLIKNPYTHDLLVTLSDINASEWEILISGRFDGFLWSGADADDLPTPTAESRGATPASGFFGSRTPSIRGTPGIPGSRNTTPFSVYSRGATPASFISISSSAHPNRQAVSRDEEMEIAALAEVEREIYQGMEVLEDAFEALHTRAEAVRTALRNRGAGLMVNLQNRRRIDVLPNQPTSGNSQHSGYERPAWAVGSELDGASDSEWGGDDIELMPDDSASNISSSRHRRPKRRTERRTPAPIEEDERED